MPARSGWLFAGRIITSIAALALTSTIALRSQTKPPAPRPAPSTTAAGVYTNVQADRGENIYQSMCVSCHPLITYTGAQFKQNWANRPLVDLYDWVFEKMPKNEPGILSPQESTQVFAYILRLNMMPPGKTELAPDRAALRRVRI